MNSVNNPTQNTPYASKIPYHTAIDLKLPNTEPATTQFYFNFLPTELTLRIVVFCTPFAVFNLSKITQSMHSILNKDPYAKFRIMQAKMIASIQQTKIHTLLLKGVIWKSLPALQKMEDPFFTDLNRLRLVEVYSANNSTTESLQTADQILDLPIKIQALVTILKNQTSDPHSTKTTSTKLLQAAQQTNNPAILDQALLKLVENQAFFTSRKTTKQTLEKVKQLIREIQSPAIKAEALILLSSRLEEANYQKAREILREAQQVSETIQNPITKVKMLLTIVTTLESFRIYDEKAYQDAKNLIQQIRHIPNTLLAISTRNPDQAPSTTEHEFFTSPQGSSSALVIKTKLDQLELESNSTEAPVPTDSVLDPSTQEIISVQLLLIIAETLGSYTWNERDEQGRPVTHQPFLAEAEEILQQTVPIIKTITDPTVHVQELFHAAEIQKSFPFFYDSSLEISPPPLQICQNAIQLEESLIASDLKDQVSFEVAKLLMFYERNNEAWTTLDKIQDPTFKDQSILKIILQSPSEYYDNPSPSNTLPFLILKNNTTPLKSETETQVLKKATHLLLNHLDYNECNKSPSYCITSIKELSNTKIKDKLYAELAENHAAQFNNFEQADQITEQIQDLSIKIQTQIMTAISKYQFDSQTEFLFDSYAESENYVNVQEQFQAALQAALAIQDDLTRINTILFSARQLNSLIFTEQHDHYEDASYEQISPFNLEVEQALLKAKELIKQILDPIIKDHSLLAMIKIHASFGNDAIALQTTEQIQNPDIKDQALLTIVKAQVSSITVFNAPQTTEQIQNPDIKDQALLAIVSSGRLQNNNELIALIQAPLIKAQALLIFGENQASSLNDDNNLTANSTITIRKIENLSPSAKTYILKQHRKAKVT